MQGILKTKLTFSNKKRSDNIHYPIVIVYQNYEKRKNTMSNVINKQTTKTQSALYN